MSSERDERVAGEGGHGDHQVHGRGGDVGGQADADLPAEAAAVDPAAELVEPRLVHLAGVRRQAEPTEVEVGRDRDGREHRGGAERGLRRSGRARRRPPASTAAPRPSVAPPSVAPRMNQAAVEA